MARTLWNAADRESLLARFGRLSPDAVPKWGSLDAPRMLTHVTDAIRASMGEVSVAPVRGPLEHWPLNTLVMFYLPWPKGAPTAPELLQRKPTAWAGEVDTLRATMDRFAARDANGDWSRHLAFGNLTGAQWGRLMYRHSDYHLGQFRT